MATAKSCHGVTIRLTDERWTHIEEEHAELAGMRSDVMAAISAPERVVAGKFGELFAVHTVDDSRVLMVVYKEVTPEDGFVITAFITSQIAKLDRRTQIWPRRS